MNSRYAKENLSTEQSSPREEARLQIENGDQKRSRRFETPPGKRTQTLNGSALLNSGFPKTERLLKRPDFLRVYAKGKRFEGRLMTAFILQSEIPQHRAGITATKKGVGKAHDRNRAKRLLREVFRLSKPELSGLQFKYELVLNARRNLPRFKLEQALQDFRRIVEALEKSELEKGEINVAG